MENLTSLTQTWPSTHWSAVSKAGHAGEAEKRKALTAVVTRYLPVIRWHLHVRRRIKPSEIDDLIQEFFLSKVLEQDLLQRAERERGRFRSFLATALDRFVINRLRDDKALKRKPAKNTCFDYVAERAELGEVAEDAFDIAWARQLLGQSVRKMRKECVTTKRSDIWDVFKSRIVDPTIGCALPVSYSELVRRNGFISPAQASNVLVTANRMFIRIIRDLVATYEKDDENIDQEIADLFRIASRAGNRRRACNSSRKW